MRTSELKGAMLDYWVARAEGWVFGPQHKTLECDVWRDADGRIVGTIPASAWKPSTDWAQGGPIIERERIKIMPTIPTGQTWYATMSRGDSLAEMEVWRGKADAPLVAAMRAYVTSKFGDKVQEGSESNG